MKRIAYFSIVVFLSVMVSSCTEINETERAPTVERKIVETQASGKIVSRSDLISQLRGFDYDGFDRSIDLKVSRLRKKLSDNSAQPMGIKTIWGKGYLFVKDAC